MPVTPIKMRYRLALDLGTTSLGWAMIRLNEHDHPCAIIKAGVRIFSDGRNPKDGTSLAVTRRDARAMRRRRDRLLKRKARMMAALIEHGFFPQDAAERKALEKINPYALRARGLDAALTPAEFARALFHINQRRGFKSNRKTDKADNDSGALKTAISTLRAQLEPNTQGKRTVGELLYARMIDPNKKAEERTVRARLHITKATKPDGKTRIEKIYDLYIDRKMVGDEFDALWAAQAGFNPTVFNETANAVLKDVLLHQRNLKPVVPGRCTLLPDEPRAPLALPSTQRFRMYQEVNNLRILNNQLQEGELTLGQRNDVIDLLEANSKVSFTKIKTALKLGGAVQFNIEDAKRVDLKGNLTSAILSGGKYFADKWLNFTESVQDEIVLQLLKEESETKLVAWLQTNTGVSEALAEQIANAPLPDGYGNLSSKALDKILPALRQNVITYDKAVIAAGFDHHSHLNPSLVTGEILPALPYYGEPLQRFVGFGTGNLKDSDEKRFGRIANPTVHVGLNQVRTVVNALIQRYGHPSEIIVEVARDLKQSKAQRDEDAKRQTINQKRNERIRADIARMNDIPEEQVKHVDIQKWILWEELSFDPLKRMCPYSGVVISAELLLSPQVEIEHILPYSRTLDDSLNNKTVAMRVANRVKGNQTPWEAFGLQQVADFDYAAIIERADLMPKGKRYRFAEDGFEKWLKDDKGFLARALNDTRYLSRVAKEYLSLICPQNTRVIPGQMTAKLRGHLGLNNILGLDGLKNRNDHRHHAVDACVIAITDQGMLQRFASASASARALQLDRLVEKMPDPWPTYREHVKRAIAHIYISHKPDHSYEGQMHEDTAWGLRPDGVTTRRVRNEETQRRERDTKSRSVITFNSTKDTHRHGLDEDGQVKAYKGYVGGSNFCMDIVRSAKGKWDGEIVSTFTAYQIMRECVQQHGLIKGREECLKKFRSRTTSLSGKPLVMRLQNGDMVKMMVNERWRLMRVVKMNTEGQISFIEHNEANVNARDKEMEWTPPPKGRGQR